MYIDIHLGLDILVSSKEVIYMYINLDDRVLGSKGNVVLVTKSIDAMSVIALDWWFSCSKNEIGYVAWKSTHYWLTLVSNFENQLN